MKSMAAVHRPAAAFLIALPLLLTLGCTAATDLQSESPAPTEPQGFGVYDDFRAEYQSTVDRLSATLPDGASFPEQPPGQWDADGSFEGGTGDVTAALYWRCAWTVAFIDADESGDEAGRSVALDQLSAWVEFPEIAANSNEELAAKWRERVIEPTAQGDSAPVRTLLDGCG